MITLHNLIQQGLVFEGNTICFNYKGNTFEGVINSIGVIYKSFVCKEDSTKIEIFKDRLPFESLSNWSDSCIQDICKEYVTRFSSWKRLRHKESGLSMQNLRHMYNQFFLNRVPLTNISLNTLRQYVSVFLKHIENLEEEIHGWENYSDGFSAVPPRKTSVPMHLQMLKHNYSKYLRDKVSTENEFREQQS
tara:strand:+ start:1825 stop:2397 length:573 start_codon:yes stop_codon:yes gene_type:complete